MNFRQKILIFKNKKKQRILEFFWEKFESRKFGAKIGENSEIFAKI